MTRPHCALYLLACFEIMAALSNSAVCTPCGMLSMTCYAVRFGVTSALSVQSLSLSEFLFSKKIKKIQTFSDKQKKNTYVRLYSRIKTVLFWATNLMSGLEVPLVDCPSR